MRTDLGTAPPLEEPTAWLRSHREPWRKLPPVLRRWARSYRRAHRQHFRSVCTIVDQERESARMERALEVGASPAFISALLAGAGLRVSAIDYDPDRFGAVFQSFEIDARRADIEREPFPFDDESFDLVSICQTLEHLPNDPLRPLEETARVLKPGGRVIVSVPQITPHMRWTFFRGGSLLPDPVSQRRKVERIGHLGDSRLFAREEVLGMLEFAGLEPLRVVPGGGLRARGTVTPMIRVLWRVARSRMQANLYYVATKG